MQHSFLLYVEDPLKAAAFYEKLLHAKPLEASPGFAMFALTGGTMLGLWKRADVEPKVSAPSGSNEVGFHVDSNATVEKFFAEAKQVGAAVLQAPTQMDFGYTFCVADPDGHRLRVFATA
ncbi:MAG: VOC family protein [Alphaproteobacteria bacterium]|nr:VOC family protein [Alphaproteobacteria bacterium]